MLSPEWADFVGRVEQGAKAMKIHVDRPHATQFARHAKELLEWNRFANLTAITDLKEIAEKHFLDTLPLVPLIPQGSQVLDIGSGGGFPGVPLKVMRPDLHVDLIEASRKKAHFLKHLIISKCAFSNQLSILDEIDGILACYLSGIERMEPQECLAGHICC